MIIVTRPKSKKEDIDHIIKTAESLGFKVDPSEGIERTIIGLIGDERKLNKKQFLAMPGVENVLEVLKPYKLASREFHPEDTIIEIDGVKIGGEELTIMAGPCSVESEEQIIGIAKKLKSLGVKILRGGAYKPRTSPYSFQGLEEEGLKLLKKAKDETGMLIITEIMDPHDIDLVSQYADIFQVGARNVQNYRLLKALGQSKKPVLLKRGMSTQMNELLLCAEYMLKEGNPNIMICERGIRTFCNHTRNTMDLNIVPALKLATHLPIIADPSHGTGKYELVTPIAKASVACGADGLIIEVHTEPEKSVSDADQTLSIERFQNLLKEIRPITQAVGKTQTTTEADNQPTQTEPETKQTASGDQK